MALAGLEGFLGNCACAMLPRLGLPPSATVIDMANVPEGFLRWTLAAQGTPEAVIDEINRWLLRAVHAEALRAHRVGVTSSPPEGVPVRNVPWSHLAPRPLPNHGWVEVLAGGAPMSGASIAQAYQEVFMESAALASYSAAVHNASEKVLFSFAQRAAASGCTHLFPAFDLDQSVDVSGQAAWEAPPRKRIALAAREMRAGPGAGADPRAVRDPTALSKEAGLRIQLSSIKGSWKSAQSALRAWSAYLDAVYPCRPHFPYGH